MENVSDLFLITGTGRDHVAQYWYDFLYSAPGGMGTTRSVAGTGKTRRVAWSDSNAAYNSTTQKYLAWFATKDVTPSEDLNGPDSTTTYYGWDLWTLSRPTIPILDY